MGEPISIEREGRIAIITNEDAPRNRMTIEFMDALEKAQHELEKDTSVGAVVIRGAGEEHFSVGMNLKQFGQGVKEKGSFDGILDQRLRVIRKIERGSKPWIATMYGYCLGGGLELPLGCHFRLAAEEGAKIGLPEMDLGGVPAWGGTARLTRVVGQAAALDLILRGKMISGPEAYRIGLVQEVWPNSELQKRARDLAHALAKQPSTAVAGVIDCVNRAGELSLEEALAVEREWVDKTSGSKDQQEGMRAFLEKREPRFHD
ncbi:MAG: enoyl-CoA hydratase/isomerase family protein [Myxococcota bacterium]